MELEELSIAYVLDARLKELLDLVGSLEAAAAAEADVPLGDSRPVKLLFWLILVPAPPSHDDSRGSADLLVLVPPLTCPPAVNPAVRAGEVAVTAAPVSPPSLSPAEAAARAAAPMAGRPGMCFLTPIPRVV